MKKSSGAISHLTLLAQNKHSIVCTGINSQGEVVIVKTTRIDVMHEWAKERLKNEAVILQQLAGIGGVPTFCDFFELTLQNGKKRPVLITEKMPGITLHELRKTIPGFTLTAHLCLTLLHHIATILQKVHQRGIIHHDIKLGNILVTPEHQISIIDWGAAGTIGATPTDSHIIGTVQFMSYEQVTNHILDQRTDIYSLGVLMTLLAYGEHLTPRYVIEQDGTHTQRTSDAIADAVAGGETIKHTLFPTPKNVEEQTLQEVLIGMTHRERDKRYANVQEVLSAIFSSVR